MFSNQFITNFPQNATVKNFFDKLSIFGKDMDKTLWLTFLGHPVIILIPGGDPGDKKPSCR